MKKNYLSASNSEERKEFIKKSTYIQKLLLDTETNKYFLLPEEYDVFSDLDPNLFIQSDTVQLRLISVCLSYMRERLKAISMMQNTAHVLPKLAFYKDETGTITLNWAHSNFRVFLSFEGETGNFDAYCGVVAQIEADAVSTQTRKISIENYQAAIDSIIQLVVNYS